MKSLEIRVISLKSVKSIDFWVILKSRTGFCRVSDPSMTTTLKQPSLSKLQREHILTQVMYYDSITTSDNKTKLEFNNTNEITSFAYI